MSNSVKHIILVADSQEMVRNSIKQIINESDDFLAGGEARNAYELMEQVKKEKFDIVLLDINLPDKSGIDVLSDLNDINPSLPVIITSMYDEIQFVRKALDNGARGFLRKTNVASELLPALRLSLSGEIFVSPFFKNKLEQN